MIDSDNCKLAYLAARMGLGLHLVYVAGVILWKLLPVKRHGIVIPGTGNFGFMPLDYLIPIITIILGLMLMLDKHVRTVAIIIAIFSMASGSFIPALIALGLVLFWQYDITVLDTPKSGSVETE